MMKKRQLLIKILLILYTALIAFALLFRSVSQLSLFEYIQRRCTLIPFATFGEYVTLLKQGNIGLSYVLIQIMQNIALMIPIGILMPFCSDKCRSLKTILLIATPCYVLLEGLQLLLKVGSFDTTDILLYILGTVLGYTICKAIPSTASHQKMKSYA